MQPADSAKLQPEEIDGVEYVTAAQVAQHVGVSRQTLWRWRQDGKVPAGHRFRDRRILFTLEDVDEVYRFANRVEPIDHPSQGQLDLFRAGKTR